MTRAAIYARISQTHPNVEARLDQEKRCRVLAERGGYEIVAVRADDGISGFTDNTRPG
ncbi:recombinase family protein [Leifsonia sp. 1010]|uniref:recombinase family protein n=1 Tax=Leifsonia sp. 1010 TaxID=2817769 RepID=UPI0037C03020